MARTCHDVRQLRICVHCKDFGDRRVMLETASTEWLHGACFIARFGIDQFMMLPPADLGRMSMADLVALTRAQIRLVLSRIECSQE